MSSRVAAAPISHSLESALVTLVSFCPQNLLRLPSRSNYNQRCEARETCL